MTPRLLVALVLGLVVIGCSAPEAPVPLLTGVDPAIGPDTNECWLNSASGVLTVDPTYGTAINNDAPFHSFTMPVMWRPGFTARQVDGHIEVLDPTGTVVAVTGRKYVIPGASTGTTIQARLGHVAVSVTTRVWWSCAKVTAR